jgi:hypothetical protein
MTTFNEAVINQSARTENGMKALNTTVNALTDLFFKIGASRGQNIIPTWTAAYVEDPELAVRIALWARDIRGGAGERKIFRDILMDLSVTDAERAFRIMKKIPEMGRWDDLLAFEDQGVLQYNAFQMIKEALDSGNSLCAKWMPRQGRVAAKLRSHFGWTPKFYRKRLVELTKVVETQMCAKDWDNIDFNKVPSVASARYKKAFARHTPKYVEWVNKLVSDNLEERAQVKVNAGALYPYEVIKGVSNCQYSDGANLKHILAQWEALPNYVGDADILPMVDVSGSMTSSAGGSNSNSKSATTCMDVAVSLGLYLADKNRGKFKDTFLTFSTVPKLLHLKGNIIDKVKQMVTSDWCMTTDLNKAFNKILEVAKEGKVPNEEMPKILLILSDMQFNECTEFDDTAMQMIARKYTNAGYDMPNIVFWNLRATDNVPVKYDSVGTALISGFSPSIVTSVLKADLNNFTPEKIMLQTIMNDRYNY